MTVDELMYKAFLTEYKVIGQCFPKMSKRERFARAVIATSDDRWLRALRINKGKIEQLEGKIIKKVFSDALTRLK